MIKENGSFISFECDKEGLLFDDSSHKSYPIKYHNFTGTNTFLSAKDSSYFVYVYKGSVFLNSWSHDFDYHLSTGMYFSLHDKFLLFGTGSAIIIEVLHKEGKYPETNYRAMFTIGGRIESEGRLKYIDGCTDSLLIPPVKFGDPCLNHLHFPINIDQTMHTHPSHRIGIVAKGKGLCKTPFGNVPLNTGDIFIIKEWDGVSYEKGLDGNDYPIGLHAFQTFGEQTMDVIAFHPDSDFGATDEVHPMINRTIVDGVSASLIDAIRTK
jgi:hypothetical protein